MRAPRALPRAASCRLAGPRVSQGLLGGGSALAAFPERSEWRIHDDATTVGRILPGSSEYRRAVQIGRSRVAPEIAALVSAAAAGGRRVPVVLGPPAGGEAQAGALTAGFQGDAATFAINSAPLLRIARAASVHAAAAALGTPVFLVLRAEPAERRIRAWLAMPGSTGHALEAGALPSGVRQLSEAALKAELDAGRASEVWAAAGDDTVCGLLAGIFPTSELPERIRIPKLAVPPALRAMLSAAGSTRAPVVLGPPVGGDSATQGVNTGMEADGRLSIKSIPLLSLLQAANAAAGAAGAPLELVFRADPTLRACRLWLAPAGSKGRAPTAPVLPAGIAQLSSAALKKRK